MKRSSVSYTAILIGIALTMGIAQIAAARPPSGTTTRASQWSVKVEKVDAGQVAIEPAFQIAIYENLIAEMRKAKTFKQVFRSGDRDAVSGPSVLTLKTIIEKYTPGSETRRAVTTVSGATKLTVRSQLCTPNGNILWEQVVGGNVRFFGGNLRATHNLARNIAKQIGQVSLPQADVASRAESDETATVVIAPF